MTLPHPGSLDERYEGNGQAPIPGQNADRLLQVLNATASADGSILCCGHSYDDEARTVFVRLDPQGHFDSGLGHVDIQPMQAPPESSMGLYAFVVLIDLGAEHDNDLLALSVPQTATVDHLYSSLAVGRFTSALVAKAGFGDTGIQFVPHTRQNATAPAHNAPDGVFEPWQKARAQKSTHAISPLDLPKACLAGDQIHVVYREQQADASDNIEYATYLITLDARSGKVGARHPIVIQGHAPLLHEVVFLDEARRLLVLGRVGEVDCLMRLTSSGALDPAFGNAGLIEIPGTGYLGLVATSDRIVVTRAPSLLPAGYASTVYQYTLEGQVDSRFNQGQPLKVPPYPSADGVAETLRLYHAAFDPQGALLLAGSQGRVTTRVEERLCVVRLRASGARDEGFGDDGYALGPDEMINGNGLYVREDGIRLLTQARNGDSYVVKRHS